MYTTPFTPVLFARCALRAVQTLRALGCLLTLLVLLGVFAAPAAQAQGIDLSSLQTERGDEALLLNFSAAYALTKPVEDALQKGVPIYFTAEVSVYRKRWYWRDDRISHLSRSWRLAWQPLTRQYRVSTGGLSQSYASLHEALASMRGAQGWRIVELSQLDEDTKHYLEFSYKLDTGQLPRPMQIGLSAPEGWVMSVSRSLNIDPAARTPP